ncbi:hypothetical protein DND58_11285 [Pseudomonas syringae pv. pisi]|nr:hypothetical protein DND62_15990 [Pseudomonas syringae pv. pisi]PYD31226.1 hypothetical protein DND58_11285 [Pseudomonas syringae pv. pisi]
MHSRRCCRAQSLRARAGQRFACSRRRWFRPAIFGACIAPFASKLAPTSTWILIRSRASFDIVRVPAPSLAHATQ